MGLVGGLAALVILAIPQLSSESGERPHTAIAWHSGIIVLPVSKSGQISLGSFPPEGYLDFTVQDGPLSLTAYSRPTTVGEALTALGIQLRPRDRVVPTPETPLTAGLKVLVRRAASVTLVVGGEARPVETQATTVGQLLKEEGVELGPLDRVTPQTSALVKNGMAIEVVRVQVEREVQEETIPRPVEYRDDPNLLSGRSYVLQPGADGLIRREFEVRRENGREVARTLVSETTVPPQPRVVVRGTARLAPAGGNCAGLAYREALTVWATWYNPASAGGYITATGAVLDYGIVAVDPTVIPLGTRMCVPGYGIAVAADTGGGVRGYMIDLGYPAGVIPTWRTGYVTIYILN